MKPLFSVPRLPRELKQPVGISLSSATDDILLTWVDVQKKNGAPRPSRSSVIREIVEVLHGCKWSPGEEAFAAREVARMFGISNSLNRKPQTETTPPAAQLTKHTRGRR